MNYLAVCTVAVLALCQLATGTPIVSDNCRAVTEPAELFHRVTGRGLACNVTKVRDNMYVFMNPASGGDCQASFWTTKPNHMEVFPIVLDDSVEDSALRVKSILASFHKYTHEELLKKNFISVTQNTFYYDSSKDTDNSGFAFLILSRGSDCNYVCNFKENESGPLEIPEYEADTYCQSYFRVPKHCKLALKFETFNIGNRDELDDCTDDYVAVSPKGERGYSFLYSKALCGEYTDETIVSTKNSMNIVLKGVNGGYPGAKGTYHVICS